MVRNAGDIKAGGAFVEIGGDDTSLNKVLMRARNDVKGFADEATAFGKRLVGAGVALTAPLVASVKVAADFSDELQQINTLLSETQEAEFLAGFEDRLKSLSTEIGESVSTLSRGLFDIISASIEPSKALDVLEVSSKAAAAGMTDTGTAADAITTILNSYQLAAEDAASVTDLFFAINKRGKTTFAQLAPTIGAVASTAAASGLKLEELGAALATLTRNGVNTANAVTSVQAVVSSFLRPTDEAKEAAEALGFSLNTATLRSEGLLGVFRKLQGVDAETVAKIFPNIRALKGVNAALQDLEGFGVDLELMYNRTGEAQEAFEDVSESLGFKIRQLKQEIAGLVLEVGQALVPVALDIVMGMKAWVKAVAAAIKQNPDFIKSLLKLGKSMIAIGGSVIAIGTALKLLFTLLSPGGLIKGAILAVIGLAEAFGLVDLGIRESIQSFGQLASDFDRELANVKEQFDELTKSQEEKAEADRRAALEDAPGGRARTEGPGTEGLGPTVEQRGERSISPITGGIISKKELDEILQARKDALDKAAREDEARNRKTEREAFFLRRLENQQKQIREFGKFLDKERTKFEVLEFEFRPINEQEVTRIRRIGKVQTSKIGAEAIGTFIGAIGGQFKGTGIFEKLLVNEREQLAALKMIVKNTENLGFG